MPENEPGSGLEVYKTVARLGLDVTSAIKSGEDLAKALQNLDTSLSQVLNTAKQAGPVLNELFGKSFGTKAFQDALRAFEKYQKQMDILLLAQQKKELTSLSQGELKKVLAIQKTEAQIAAIKEAARKQEERKEALHKQRLQQQEELHAKRLAAIELRRRGAQTPWGEAFGYRASWFVSGTIFYGSIRAAQALVNTAAEVEESMARVRSVMDAQTTDFAQLQASIMDTAKAYGQLVPKLADATIEWAKQGRTQKEIQDLLRPTALLANVGDIEEITDAVRLLTAATKQFNIPASDAMDVIDKWTAVADATAVSVRDLGEATAIAGKVAYTMGVSFDELAAHAAALGEATGKSGKQVGQSLKTIYAYLYRPETVALLEKMGFRVKENAETFRDFNDIIADIAKRWTTMTNVEQHSLAMKAAGARRISDFITLLNAHNRAVEATIIAMSSMGSAERKNEEIMKTYNKQVQQLRASIQELCVEMGEAGLLDTLKGVANMSSRAIENFKNWNPVLRQTVEVLGMVAAALTAVNMAWNFIGGQTLLQAIGKGDALKGLANIASFISGLAAIPWVPWAAGIAAVGVGAASLAAGIKKGKEEAGELARKLEEHLRSYDALAKVMADNKKGTVEYTVASREQIKVMNAIRDLVPDMIEAYDEQGNAIKFNREELEKLITKQKEYAGQTSKQLFMQREQVRAQLEDIRKNREKWIKQLAEETPLGSAAGVIQPDPETEQIVRRRAEQALRDFESKLRKQEEVLSQYLYAEAQPAVLARYAAWTAKFGGPHAPKGVVTPKQESLAEEERDIWPALEKTLPVIAKADEAIKQLEQRQRALALQHEREIALLPAYASAIDETNLKIKQNAELIKENQTALATATRERDAVKKALDAEIKKFNELRATWNNMTKEEQESSLGKEHAKALREAEKNVSALQSKYDALDKQVTDYQNNAISLSTKTIELDKQRNKLMDEFAEAAKKAQRALEDLLGVQAKLTDIRLKQEWADIQDADEATKAQLRIDEYRAQLEQLRTEEGRLLADALAAQEKGIFGQFDELMVQIVENWEAQRALHEKIAMEEWKINRYREAETRRAITERYELHEMDLENESTYWKTRLAAVKEGTKEYIDIQNKLDELDIRAKEAQRAKLYVRLGEPLSPEERLGVIRQLNTLWNEIQVVQANIAKRTREWQEKEAEAAEKRTMEYLKAIGQGYEAEFRQIDKLQEKYDLEHVLTTPEGRIQWDAIRAAKRGKVWAKIADERIQAILDNVRLTSERKLEELRALHVEFLVKGAEGIAASDRVQRAIQSLAEDVVREQNEALEKSLEAEGFGLDLALARARLEPNAAVRAQLEREAMERYGQEELRRITGSLVLTPQEQLNALDALAAKYRAYKDIAPEFYASIAEAQENVLKQVQEEEAALERQRLAIERAGLDTYKSQLDAATKGLRDWQEASQDEARTLEAINKEIDLNNKALDAAQTYYTKTKAAALDLANTLGHPLLQKMVAGQPLTEAEAKELAAWAEGLTPALKETYQEFTSLLEVLGSLDSQILSFSVRLRALGKEAALLPIQEKFAALNASLDEFARLMSETAIAEEYFADGLNADVQRMEILRQKMKATKEVGEAYKEALDATTERLKALLPEHIALFDALASGVPLTKEQAEAFGALYAQLDKLPDEVAKLLPLLVQLRNENGKVSQSILDQAFTLYRATLAAKGLVDAYDAILSGAKELKGTFDYRQELRGLEERYNFNYLFGRPAERAMEDWQAEFDAIRVDMEAIARISAGVRVLGSTQEDEEALARLKEELKKLAETQPALGLTEEQIEAFGTDAAQAMEIAATAAGNLENRLESLVSRRYFLELAREAEEMGRSFEQNIEGAFERALSDLISGKGDLLNILATFGQTVVSSMADMLAKGLTRRIFGDPNDPNSLAGRITQWATGQAGDALGIQTSMTTGAQVAGSTIQTAIVTGGQQVASMWSAVLRTAPVGVSNIIPGMPSPGVGGSVAGWRMLEAASMAGASAITMPAVEGSVAGWRMLESASTAGLAGASGGGGLLGFLTKAGGGFNWPLAIGTFALSLLLSGIQKKLSQPLAPKPQDQYVYKITSPEFNPFASPERAYYAGTGREHVEVRNFNLNIERIVAADGTDAGTKIFQRIKQLERSGTWGRTR